MRLGRKSDPDLPGEGGEFDSNYTKSHGEHALSLGNTMLAHWGAEGGRPLDTGSVSSFTTVTLAPSRAFEEIT